MIDGHDKRYRIAAGKGQVQRTAAGDKSVDDRQITDWALAAVAKTTPMPTINAGWAAHQPLPCRDARA